MARKSSFYKKYIFRIIKGLIAGVFMIILGTIGIDAVDHHDNLSESLVGRLIFGGTDGPCPFDMVFVQDQGGGFCIDKYEASPSEACPFSDPNGIRQSRDNLDRIDCIPVSRVSATPWTGISQNQAVMACAKADKRLASNREWSLAALGTPDQDSDWTELDCQVANNWGVQPGLTGSGKNCFSYAGAHDMIGNVWEWVDGAVHDGIYEGRPLPKAGYVYGINESDGFPSNTDENQPIEYYGDYFWLKGQETRAIARGGYWNNKAEAGQYAHYVVAPPTYTGDGVGFRCASNAPSAK